MPAFSVSPLVDVPPPQAANFPDFIQFQDDGTDLGLADADTLNFAGGLRATRGVGENSNVVSVEGAALSWRAFSTDTTIEVDDLENGIESTAEVSPVTVTIPSGLTADSRPILVFQRGAAAVSILADVGVQLIYRAAFAATLGGQYATATLIQREADVWILCGDLEAAA